MTTVLIPGSFDPLHLGHIDIVDQAVELFGNVVVGVLYNYEKPSGLFTPDERVELARASLADLPTVDVEKFAGSRCRPPPTPVPTSSSRACATPVDFDIEQQMAHMNRSSAGVRTVFLPCRPDVGFISSRFIREIAAHGGAVDHLVTTPVAVALADRFAGASLRLRRSDP